MREAEVKEKYESKLLSIKGVVGVSAYGGKIIVYVEDADTMLRLPRMLEGVPVEPKIVGKVHAWW